MLLNDTTSVIDPCMHAAFLPLLSSFCVYFVLVDIASFSHIFDLGTLPREASVPASYPHGTVLMCNSSCVVSVL